MAAVAVVTRTKDRLPFLRRAMASVASQTFKDLEWVVVNDGGAPGPVDAVVREAGGLGIRARVVHQASSRGMEAASNAGIRASQSEFIAVHDDDDSWEPAFLDKAAGFLASDGGRRYGGVVVRTTQVDEVLRGGEYRAVARTPFNDWLSAVHLADVARSNPFPPISFLYRRGVYDLLKGYDEGLAVLGDWEFNLRFLLNADIAVIPERLANYHRRLSSGGADGSANSAADEEGLRLHLEHDALIRNRLLREDLAAGRMGLGFLVNFGKLFNDVALYNAAYIRSKLLGSRGGALLLKGLRALRLVSR